MIKRLRVDLLCRRLSWLWSVSHTSRLAQLISDITVLHVFRVRRLVIVFNAICWNLGSYELKLGRLKGSHPRIHTNPSASVIAPQYFGCLNCPLLFDDLLITLFSILLALSSGFNFIVRSHPPGVCVNSIFCSVLGSKLKPCLCVAPNKPIDHNLSSQ